MPDISMLHESSIILKSVVVVMLVMFNLFYEMLSRYELLFP